MTNLPMIPHQLLSFKDLGGLVAKLYVQVPAHQSLQDFVRTGGLNNATYYIEETTEHGQHVYTSSGDLKSARIGFIAFLAATYEIDITDPIIQKAFEYE